MQDEDSNSESPNPRTWGHWVPNLGDGEQHARKSLVRAKLGLGCLACSTKKKGNFKLAVVACALDLVRSCLLEVSEYSWRDIPSKHGRPCVCWAMPCMAEGKKLYSWACNFLLMGGPKICHRFAEIRDQKHSGLDHLSTKLPLCLSSVRRVTSRPWPWYLWKYHDVPPNLITALRKSLPFNWLENAIGAKSITYILQIGGILVDVTRCNILHHEDCLEFIWCNSSGLAVPELWWHDVIHCSIEI